MSSDNRNTIRIPLPRVRNLLVPLMRMRKGGAHGKTNKALRRRARQTLHSSPDVD